MIKALRFLTTPVFAISYLWHILVAFPWSDGKIIAYGNVMDWQSNDDMFEDEE